MLEMYAIKLYSMIIIKIFIFFINSCYSTHSLTRLIAAYCYCSFDLTQTRKPYCKHK